MVSVTRTFTVSKPLEEVISYLADFSHAEAWDPGTKSCKQQGPGPVKVGTTWDNVSEFRGKETELTYRLVSREKHQLVFEGTNKTATSTDDMRFSSVPAGTEITYHAHIQFHGLIKLFGWVAQGEFNKLGDQTAEKMTKVINGL